MPEADILRLRKGYGDIRTASINLILESAKTAITASKVRIDWVACGECGEKGRTVKDCGDRPNNIDSAHITGGSTCPVFR